MTRSTQRSYAYYVLGILLLVYTFNFIDRVIIGILAPPIKAELGLSDTQLGLLGGTAFALFYTGLGIPIAWLADRFNRVWIMTAALAVWSGFTAACGVVQSFSQLFFARLGVGVGEAGGVAPAYSLIADYFPSHQRARALGVYSFGIPLGSALGLMIGGIIASQVNWRWAFVVVGVAGVLVAPLFLATVREPVRGALDPGGSTTNKPPPMRVALGILARKPSFWGLAFGAATSSMMGYGLAFWMPSLFVRSFGLSLIDVSWMYGIVVLVSGITGIWIGAWLADHYGRRSRAAYALVPAITLLAGVPFMVGGALSRSFAVAIALFCIPEALRLAWLGPVLAAIQQLVVPQMRATASAAFLFINNLIGLGLGSLLLGKLSDSLRLDYGDESLRYAIVFGSGLYVISAALFFWCARRLARDWTD
ncbi:MAG: MFS transporter [Pseudomonadales bacterium]|nr:MFS transporter [Pseudomonadales bacterium]